MHEGIVHLVHANTQVLGFNLYQFSQWVLQASANGHCSSEAIILHSPSLLKGKCTSDEVRIVHRIIFHVSNISGEAAGKI